MDNPFPIWLGQGMIHSSVSCMKDYDIDNTPGVNNPQRILCSVMCANMKKIFDNIQL